MKRIPQNQIIFWSLIAVLAIGAANFVGIGTDVVSANNAPQTLPFSQDWSNTGLISVNDDWGSVPGVVGYRGDDLTTATGTDPRTILADGSGVVDVNANQTNPDTFNTGGVTEFEITNPTIALNGSGTADAPHLVVYLNTTGRTSINFSCNVRDIDGSIDDAVQQVDVQYRIGSAGNYVSAAGGYVADATTGGTATQVTPLSLSLPAGADNQALVEVRIITTNAAGNDEAVGIDDISVTGTGGGTPTPTPDANVDFNGDGRTDWVVTRGAPSFSAGVEQSGAGAAQPTNRVYTGRERLALKRAERQRRAADDGDNSGDNNSLAPPILWYTNFNGTDATSIAPFGDQMTDWLVPEDYDGDGRDDLAVWRPDAPGAAAFYIYQSATNTLRTDFFGQEGDYPAIVGDYDGDNKADPATFRCPESTPGQCYFFYRGSLTPTAINYVPWGFGAGDDVLAVPGDYDGDGKYDFCVQRIRPGTTNDGQFILLKSNGFSVEFINWGSATDFVVPGDYDGDGRFDFCVSRTETLGGVQAQSNYILERDGGGTEASPIRWGLAGDVRVPGDYDGDGRQDIAIWRPSTDPAQNFFYVRHSSDGALQTFKWGSFDDVPAASWHVQ